MAKLCPCTSRRPYAECCGPLHKGMDLAGTPEVLMRSRFAAFAMGDAGYLLRTTHPQHADRKRPEEEILRAYRETSRGLKWMRLRILDAQGSQVLFLASVFEKGQDRSFVELSTFADAGDGWLYLAGYARAAADIEDMDAMTIASLAPAAT